MKGNGEEKPVFVDLCTDFGFKRCLGNEKSMKSLLNVILSDDYGVITQVKFESVELPPDRKEQRGVTFDLRCTTEEGFDILVEMQNYSQKLFKTRANYYLCRMMSDHIKEGFNWNKDTEIPRLLGIFILGKEMEGIGKLITRTAECDLDTKEEFWNRMRKYFISLPHYKKEKHWLTKKDVWIYVLKNLGNMKEIDPMVYEMADEGLLELIEKARVSQLTPEEYAIYKAEMKIIGDAGSAEWYGYDRGKKDGLKEGLEKGKKEEKIITARKLRDVGMAIETISNVTGLTEEEIQAL